MAEKEEAEHTHLCGSNETGLSVMQRWIEVEKIALRNT